MPFKTGEIEVAAAAIVYFIASINHLFDHSTGPYMSPDYIYDFFATKEAAVTDKIEQVRYVNSEIRFSS